MEKTAMVALFLWIGFVPLAAQLDLTKKQEFLDIVEPIITEGELEIFKSLPDYDSRKYFTAIFWHKRDPEPETAVNSYRENYLARLISAGERFSEGKTPGSRTDRGRVFLLLGEPDDVTQKKIPNAGLRPGLQETWRYDRHDLSLRFIFDGLRQNYRLQDRQQWEPEFEKIRNEQVLDRAEPFQLESSPLTLPNLGFTKDIENLASEDRHEMDFFVSYSFFKGDLNQTEVRVGLTFQDASERGVDIHLAAYDPYENKVKEIKKLIEPVNGVFQSFSMPVEPDQYNMILRLTDKDGRQDISRSYLDVPRIGGLDQSVSSILLAPDLKQVPLFGFDQPKKFVFGNVYFPAQNYFPQFDGERLFLLQHFYRFPTMPELKYYLNQKEVPGRIEQTVREENGFRTVVSIPVGRVSPGVHYIKSLYRDEAGNQAVTPVQWIVGEGEDRGDLIDTAPQSNRFEIIHPAGDDIAELDRVVVRVPDDLNVQKMLLYLNGKLVLERHQSPWEVYVDEGLYSISGRNVLSVVLDTDEGVLKAEKMLTPLVAKEKIQTRVVQIYFNAFDENLEFKHDLDVSTLSVRVDGLPHKALEIRKVEKPITYCFVVDTSYSMKDSFASNISAVKKFIQNMRPQDKGYFVSFNNNYVQYLEPTPSKSVLMAVAENLRLQRPNPKMADRLYEENQTYLYDAMISAVHTLLQYTGRKVVLLVSDGIGKEAVYSRAGMLSYAREHEAVIYSLWLDNNPNLTEDERGFLETEMGGGEKFARKIGLSRFFSKKDARARRIGSKVRNASITEGLVKILSEESGGFHYRIFRANRTLIREYVTDIEEAVASQYVMSLNLPTSQKDHTVAISSSDPNIRIRNKSKVKVKKSNPLLD